jgi:ABC-2 type transport system permease protein
MSTQSNAMSDSPLESQGVAPAVMPSTRPMYWSVRREVWENRAIYIAPLSVAAVVLFGFLVSTARLAEKTRTALTLGPAKLRSTLVMPYDIAAALIMVTAFLVGIFYCLDALYGERRDRSILFWKSLPVSDLTTVLSKATIPLVVLPLFIFVVILATQIIMLLLNTAVLVGSGLNAATLWEQLKFFQSSLAMFYALIAIALWHAPLYAWLLMVSAWARRTPFLWAVLPPLALCVLEKIALNTTHFAHLLGYRLIGWFTQGFIIPMTHGDAPRDPLAQLSPGKFLATPGLWLGLIASAIFLAVAVRLRRYRDPI